MIQTVEGVFRDGKVVLLETPASIKEARVFVTFLPEGASDDRLTAEEWADVELKLEAWREDWSAPGMEAYDDYETRRRGAGPVSAQ